MKKLHSRYIALLHQNVEELDGDWAAAASELEQFQESCNYRQGIRVEFSKQHHHDPTWRELVDFWYRFAIRRSICFRPPRSN